ncbi:hypothetical protein MC885_017976 [Smutsia gigantea]|nr:hypothetical protein MC885_017976 [Smutsia gigantea]
MALTAELTRLPGTQVRGPRKSATCFFRELREEPQYAPAVTPLGSPSGPEVSSATVSPTSLKNNREQVEVTEFHSGNKKRRQKLDPDDSTKNKTNPLEKDEQIKGKRPAKAEGQRMAQDTDIFKKKKRKGQEDRKLKKKKSAPSIMSSGQSGKFKNGTLILSQVDIKKINSSRVAK